MHPGHKYLKNMIGETHPIVTSRVTQTHFWSNTASTLTHSTSVSIHYGEHVCWLYCTSMHSLFIAGVNSIDEVTVPLSIFIEIVPKCTINENINDIRKTDEQLEMKLLQ